MYFTEYEISLMPEGDQQVLYYEQDSNNQRLSTARPGWRGHLGEEREERKEREEMEGEVKKQGEYHQKQRHPGLLSSGSTNTGDFQLSDLNQFSILCSGPSSPHWSYLPFLYLTLSAC